MVVTADLSKFLAREDEIIAALEDNVAAVLSDLMDQMIGNYGRSLMLTYPRNDAINLMVDTLSVGWSASVVLGTEELDALTRKADSGLTIRSVAKYISTYGGLRVRQISETTVTQITKLIQDGQRQGKSPGEIAKLLLNRVPQIASQRAKIIATTEVHAASQFGLLEAAFSSQKVLTKTWNTVEDDRVRSFAGNSAYSHRAMQNVRITITQRFNVPHVSGSTEGLMFPGDPEGSAGNVVNCRCSMTFEEK